AADVIDVGRLLGQDRRVVKRGAYCDHQLQPFGNSGESSGGGPGVERRRLFTLNVVQIQLGDQSNVVTDLFTAVSEPFDVFPGRRHVLVVNIAQPAAEDRKPIAVAHDQDTSAPRDSRSSR